MKRVYIDKVQFPICLQAEQRKSFKSNIIQNS